MIGIIDSLLLSYLIDNVLYSNAKFTLFTIAIIMILISIFQIALKGYKNNKIPTLIIHGTGDKVIPYTESLALKEKYPDIVKT